MHLAWMFPWIFLGSSSSAQVSLSIICRKSVIHGRPANVLDTIPAPLLDRMEVIEVSGYVSEEKSMIAERYLGPQAKEASGLKDADVMLDPASVDVLIKYYCRESGVRNLKKHIDKIYRKASLKIVEDLGEDAFPEAEAQPTAPSAADKAVPAQDPPVNEPAAPETATPRADAETSSPEKKVTTEKRKPFKVPDSVHILITPENLKDYVGPPVYHKDRMYVRAPPAGVSTGLGYLGNGSGAVMPIEATVSPLSACIFLHPHDHMRTDNARQRWPPTDG
jgi:Lon-like ATP-dependent protease